MGAPAELDILALATMGQAVNQNFIPSLPRLWPDRAGQARPAQQEWEGSSYKQRHSARMIQITEKALQKATARPLCHVLSKCWVAPVSEN